MSYTITGNIEMSDLSGNTDRIIYLSDGGYATGSSNLYMDDYNNYLLGGTDNSIYYDEWLNNVTIVGGSNIQLEPDPPTSNIIVMIGGQYNIVGENCFVVVGGEYNSNNVAGENGVMVGGSGNTLGFDNSVYIGGVNNSNDGERSVMLGGSNILGTEEDQDVAYGVNANFINYIGSGSNLSGVEVSETPITLTSGTTTNWNLSDSRHANLYLTNNTTLTLSNPTNGKSGVLIVTNDATTADTAYQITFTNGEVVNGGNSKVVLSTGGYRDVLSYVYDGSKYYWTAGYNYVDNLYE
jgi:hypothetical protein